MNGEIKTFKELNQFDSMDDFGLKCTYLILIQDKDTETEKYYIDAVYSETY